MPVLKKRLPRKEVSLESRRSATTGPSPVTSVAVGIDHSLASTGLVAVEVRTGELVTACTIEPKSRGVLRLRGISEELEALLELQPSIAHVCMEEYGFDAASRHSALGEAGGIIKVTLYEALKVPVGFPSIPTSNQVKKYVLGKGTGSKDQMRLGVYKRWGFEHRSNDVVDAYALAQIARAIVNPDVQLTSFQKDVLDTMRLPPKKKGKPQSPRIHAEMPTEMRYDLVV